MSRAHECARATMRKSDDERLSKNMIRPGTINTILNNAPLVIQGATRLIKMIKEKNHSNTELINDDPATLEGLSVEIEKINAKIDDNSAADVEQIKLIEQLARQNEALAGSLKQMLRRQTLIFWIAVVALSASIIALVTIFNH